MLDSRFGWKPDVPDIRDWLFRPSRGKKPDLPDKVSLKPTMPAVSKQGLLGDCTAHAVISLYVYQHIGSKRIKFTPSSLFVYYNTRLIENTVPLDCGASLRSAIKALATYGVCDVSCWPSDESKLRAKPYKRCYIQANRKPKLEYFRVDHNLHSIKLCLFQNKPVVCGISAYDSYESEETVKTGFVDRPEFTERCLGGHAIVLTGYDDIAGVFEFRNSQGKEWGIDGYGTIPYSYILDRYLSDDFWTINPTESAVHETTNDNKTGGVA